jgi:hypothetical protein
MSHPIIPSQELVEAILKRLKDHPCKEVTTAELITQVITEAAQWGADQELEACCEWLVSEGWFKYEHEAVEDLRAARRPKPPSLKEQALDALTLLCKGPDATAFVTCRDTIRRALEQLPDHE